MVEVDRSKVQHHGRVVAWDAYSGEPIAWLAIGEPVVGTLCGGAGPVAYTHLLTVEEAIDVYGPISEGGGRRATSGFRRVCFDETAFSAADLGRSFDISTLPDGVVPVEDPDLEWPCPRCVANPGQRCNGTSKHRVRHSDGEEYQRLQGEIADSATPSPTFAGRTNYSMSRCTRCGASNASECRSANGPPELASHARPTHEAITYPIPIESCRIHLTPEGKTMIAAAEAQRHVEFTAGIAGNQPPA